MKSRNRNHMKKNLILPAIGLFAITIASPAHAAQYITSFDSAIYTTGGLLSGKDGWVSQANWTVDGVGNITTDSGNYIRAQNTTVQSTNAIGVTVTTTTAFTLGSLTNDTNNASDIDENMYRLFLTERVGDAGGTPRIFGGIAYEDDGANAGKIVLRSYGSDVVVGTLAELQPLTWTMSLAATKLNSTQYSVTLSAVVGGNTYTSLANTTTPDALLSGASTVVGGIQAMNSITTEVNSIIVSDYSFDTAVVPEPSTALLCGIGAIALLRRRRA
jgi:hypothetical protein